MFSLRFFTTWPEPINLGNNLKPKRVQLINLANLSRTKAQNVVLLTTGAFESVALFHAKSTVVFKMFA